MKRILLLMWVLLLGISMQAQTTITLSGGDLKTQFEALASPPTTLIIEGTLNSNDAAYLKSIGCQNILMDNAEFADDEAIEAISFADNTTVENIVLPKGMEDVKPTWFSGCTELNAAISYTSNSKTVRAHVNKVGTLRTTIDKAQGLTRTSIEEAIMSGNIGQKELTNQYGTDYAFQGCHMKHYDLTNCTLSSTNDLLYAGNDGWANTDYLEQLELPSNLTAIPANCFQGCKHLKTLYLPSTITTIGAGSFSQCDELETIEFGKGFTSLSFENDVFKESKSLKHIVLPEGLENIGDGMFDLCVNLESLRLPNSLKHIGKNAFKGCKSLTYLTIPSGVETIGSGAFEVSGIQDIYLMAQTVEDLPYIDKKAFGETPFTGNSSLAINGDQIDLIVDRVIKLVQRGVVTDVTVAQVQAWGANWKDGQYRVNNMPDKNILQYVPTEEMEQLYRDFVGYTDPIAYLHYPRVGNDGKTQTELGMFIDGNPWNGTPNLLDGLGGFYSRGQLDENGNYVNTTPAASLRTRDVESPRLENAVHLSDAYGIGPDAAGNYWPDTNHQDQALRTQYGDPDSELNQSDFWKNWTDSEGKGITLDNTSYDGKYVGYSKYYWRNFLLQSGYSPVNDEVYSKYYDDTWYTMCFPFDLTDEQLEAAYQSNKFNLCEFSGAAILPSKKTDNTGEEVDVQNLVLCFTKIARTWYKDKYGNYYKRTRDNDQNKTKHYYQAKRTWVEKTDGTSDWDLTNVSSTEYTRTDDNADIWDSIDGILAIAGHPYMIHPYMVENLDGTATLCTLPKIIYKYDFNRRGSMNEEKLAQTMSNMADLYNSEAVTRPICTITDTEGIFKKDQDGVTQGDGKTESYGRYDDMTATQLGNYTFKGSYFPKKGEEIVAGEQTEPVIPFGAYFLGVKKKNDPNASARDKKYPKFYREISTDENRTTGLWKQYTAIITPDAGAQDWANEHLVGPTQTVQSGAKGISMLFGDFEDVVSEEVIQGIATEAQRMGLEVQRTDIIVNINGQILRPGKGVEGLPKGIYVINGKKYLVK